MTILQLGVTISIVTEVHAYLKQIIDYQRPVKNKSSSYNILLFLPYL